MSIPKSSNVGLGQSKARKQLAYCIQAVAFLALSLVRPKTRQHFIAKFATSLGFVAAASADMRAAAALCCVGDVIIAIPFPGTLIIGGVVFAVAHLALWQHFKATIAYRPQSLLIAAIIGALYGVYLYFAGKRDAAGLIAYSAYIAVCAHTTACSMFGSAAQRLGGLCFLISDFILLRQDVRDFRGAGFLVHLFYYAGVNLLFHDE